MSTETKIEFTHHSSSPWWGCTKVHEGCANCYAEKMDARFKGGNWGAKGTRKLVASFGANCRAWDRQAAKAGERRRVFPSMCDPFEEFDDVVVDKKGKILYRCGVCEESFPSRIDCPECERRLDELTVSDLRHDLFETIDACPNLDFLLFTKRPENVLSMWPRHPLGKAAEQWGKPGEHNAGLYRSNVWLVTSVSTQEHADRMIPQLLECRHLVPVLGVSYEPALGPIDFTSIGESDCGVTRSDGKLRPLLRYDALRGREDPEVEGAERRGSIDWIVAGGESGGCARPAHPDWFRSVRDQCAAADVPFFFKQWGEWAPSAQALVNGNTHAMCQHGIFSKFCREPMIAACPNCTKWEGFRKVGKEQAGRLLDGVEHNRMPVRS